MARIKTKLNRRGYFVDILPTRTRGANELLLYFTFVDGDAVSDLNHGTSLRRAIGRLKPRQFRNLKPGTPILQPDKLFMVYSRYPVAVLPTAFPLTILVWEAMFRKLFGGRKNDNPLLNAKEFSQILRGLANSDPAYALDELSHWLQLVSASKDEIKPRLRYRLITRLNETSLPHARKLLAEYIQASRMSKTREEIIWNASSEFYKTLYDACAHGIANGISRLGNKSIDNESAILGVRAMRCVGMLAHWARLRYRHPLAPQIWAMMADLFNMAELQGFAGTEVALNPRIPEQKISLLTEMVKILMMEVASTEHLTKSQMELARQITEEFAPKFFWENIPADQTVFSVDFASGERPVRLTHLAKPHFMRHCFSPGDALPSLVNSVRQLESGHVPKDLDLRRYPDYRREDLLEVCVHLAQAWDKLAPDDAHPHFDKRKYPRNKMHTHFEVVHGLEDIHQSIRTFHLKPEELPQDVIIDKLANEELVFDISRNKLRHVDAPDEEPGSGLLTQDTVDTEIWVAENGSETGYGMTIPNIANDWVREKEIVGFRKEYSTWSLGIIRRVVGGSKADTYVGIATLAQNAEAVSILPFESELTVWETAGETFSLHHTIALLLPADTPFLNENCLLLQRGSYDLHKTYELSTRKNRQMIRLAFIRETFHNTDLVSFTAVSQNK
jgi:hypothetical protein